MSESSHGKRNWSPDKHELFALLLKKKGLRIPPDETIPRNEESGPTKASFAQQRIWFLDQLEGGLPVYNVPGAYRLRGHLNVEALQQGLVELVQRHDSLRTTFEMQNDELVQIVRSNPNVNHTLVDLQHLPANQREAEVLRQASEEARKPFDLTVGPLLRVCLYQLGVEDYLLLIVVHHSISDAWSLSVLFGELSSLYEANVTGKPTDLPKLSRQYTDFAAWQRKRLRGDVLQAKLDYWTEHLSGASDALELPTDHPRSPLQSLTGAKASLPIPKETCEGLKALSDREGVTLFMTLLTVYKILLHRYTMQDDIVIGAPIANRTRPEMEGMIGCFVNTLVLRTSLSGNPTFRELLGRVRKTALKAYEHQDLPFEKLVEAVQPQRTLNRNPIFQVMFQLVNTPQVVMTLPDVEASAVEIDSGTSRFEFSLSMIEDKNGLCANVEYCSDYFEPATIQRMLRHFEHLLQVVVARPSDRIEALEILPDEERHRLLLEWNETRADVPHNTFHDLFETQVARSPDAVAATYEDQQLTYRELNTRADRLACCLKKRDVRTDVPVGIYLNRSLDILVAMLGILKAGGAYVPLDPVYPQERLTFMIQDSGMTTLVTTRSVQPTLSLPEKVKPFYIDEDWSESIPGDDNQPSETSPNDLAYVIYTSGSTGKPKGVEIPHRALVNFLCSMSKEPGFAYGETLLAVTTLSFDIAGLELLLPLCHGGRVALVGRDVAADGRRLIEALEESNATLMQATPATWRLLLDVGWTGNPELKILCGGEALPADLVGPLLERCTELWNMYGPTEATIWSTLSRVRSAHDSVSIGRPIQNTTIYILDRHQQPVPVGIPGELYIGGMGLARGYRNRADLTAERFVPNPFTDEPNARIYRTGDQGMFFSDGNIRFLGRMDDQVKIRGFRIELGEVETALHKHPALQDAVASVQEDAAGLKQIVAYVVPSNTQVPSMKDLRSFLSKTLPNYMLPSIITTLDTIPLTPNGKVDRKALPIPERQEEDNDQYVAPQDDLQLQLTKLWENILSTAPIGVKDNFFEIGGHSLLAAQLFARIEKDMGVNIPLATLFHAPTVEQLAELLRSDNWKPSWASLVPIQPEGSRPPLFCVHGAEGNVLLYRDLARHLGRNQPLYGLQAKGLDGTEPYFTRFEDMAAHYVQEIKTIQPKGPYYLGGYCLGGSLALEMAQQLHAQGDEVAFLAFLETYNIREAEPVLSSRYYRVYNRLQNILFHLNNVALLPHRDKLLFVREKMKVAKTRIARHVVSHISTGMQALGLNNGTPMPHVRITKVNDKAHENYVPKPYSGRVALFRPNRLFAGCEDPEFGWRNIIEQEIDVHVLPVFPRGMLVEPFVEVLASKLSDCLSKAEASLTQTSTD